MSFFGDFVDALRFSKRVMFDFKEATKEGATAKESLYYLFLISLVPSLITSILVYWVGSAIPSLSPTDSFQNVADELQQKSLQSNLPLNFLYDILSLVLSGLIDTQLYAITFIMSLFFILIGFTIFGAYLGAGVTHFFSGRILKWLKKDFENTLAAVVFGLTPAIIFIWLSYIVPIILGNLYLAAEVVDLASTATLTILAIQVGVGVWSLIVQIYALSNQHEISKKKAFVALIVPSIIITLIVSIISALLAYLWIASFFVTQTELVASTQSLPSEGSEKGLGLACAQSSIKMKLLFLDVYDGKDGTAVDFYAENTGKSTLRNIEVVEHYKDLSSETIKFCGNYTKSDLCSLGDERLSIPEGKQVRFDYGTSRSNFTGRIEVLTSCPDVKDDEAGIFINDSHDKVEFSKILEGSEEVSCNKLNGYIFSVVNLRDRTVSTSSLSVSIDGLPVPDFKIIWGTKFIQPFSYETASIEMPETSASGTHKIMLNNINGGYTTEEIVIC